MKTLPRFNNKIALLLYGILAFWLSSSTPVLAACEVKNFSSPAEFQKAIEECQEEINARMGAHEKNKEDLAALKLNLENTELLIKSAEAQLDQLESQINEREVDLGFQKEILAARVRSYYKRSRGYSPLLLFLASSNATELLRELSYRQIATDEDKQVIVKISQDIKNLTEDKEAVDRHKAWLAQVKTNLDNQVGFLSQEIEKVEGFFTEVTSKIAQLSAMQKALLAARAGTFTTSVGEVPLADDPNARPDYDPGFRPAFAAFSFGAWTHRKGMSQYGAKGRAESGQSAQDLLQAYYGRGPQTKDTGGTILVDGYGALDFENYYLLGIAEMPSSWPTEALKAQAIAARSYAYRYKVENRSICTTQSCQVFSSSKANNPPGEWRAAVEATRGQVVEEVTTFYSSTTGGYLTTSGWDTTCGSADCWTDGAWEKIANSPWFYKGWYTQGYQNSSAKCDRGHPWLNQEEMADILNAWLVRQNGNDQDVARILPVTINQCPVGGGGGNPYSLSELREKANQLGGAFTSISAVSVTYSQNGETSSLNFATNKGSVTISGGEFKQAFNLRAPGYIAIRSPLFNIEKK